MEKATKILRHIPVIKKEVLRKEELEQDNLRLRNELITTHDDLSSTQMDLEGRLAELARCMAAAEMMEKERNSLGAELTNLQSVLSTTSLERDSLAGQVTVLVQDIARITEQEQKLKWEVVNLNQTIGKLHGTNAPAVQYFPPGHFYSSIPSLEDIHRYYSEGHKPDDRMFGIELEEKDQLILFREFYSYYLDQPFSIEKEADHRYYFKNDFFSYGDGLTLHFMMRHLKPKRMIEVGSGFSSAVILDTNEQFFNGSIVCSFIEPYNERLRSLLRKGETVDLIENKLQDVDVNIFKELESGDILFIDSTHVSKFNSDVNHLFFNILPILKKGVVVHIHDIFYPFEYPSSWFELGITWNEAYILRAFLQYNKEFKIKLWGNYLWSSHKKEISDSMPLFAKNPGGSIWLERL